MTTNKFINTLLTMLKKLDWSYKICNTNNEIFDKNQLPYLSKYVPFNLNNLEGYDRIKKKLYVPYTRSSVFIEIHHMKQDAHMIENVLNFIIVIIYLLNNVFDRNMKKISISIYLLDDKKLFPKNTIQKNEYISSMSVNSGLTLFLRNNPTIVIYRKEELLKVLIHELLHSHFTHPITPYDTYYDEYVKNKYNVINEDSLNLYEAYVETIALLMNTTLYTYCMNNDCTLNDVLKNVAKETKYTQKMVNDISHMLKGHSLKEKTNVFSYFFVKLSFLQNLDRFFDSIDDTTFTIEDEDKYLTNVLNSLEVLKINKSKRVSSSSMKMTSLDIL